MRVATIWARSFASGFDAQFSETHVDANTTKQGAHVMCRSIIRPPLHARALARCRWSRAGRHWARQSLSGLLTLTVREGGWVLGENTQSVAGIKFKLLSLRKPHQAMSATI